MIRLRDLFIPPSVYSIEKSVSSKHKTFQILYVTSMDSLYHF